MASQPSGVFGDHNLGSRPDSLRDLCQALRPLATIRSAAVGIDVTDEPSLIRSRGIPAP